METISIVVIYFEIKITQWRIKKNSYLFKFSILKNRIIISKIINIISKIREIKFDALKRNVSDVFDRKKIKWTILYDECAK